MLACLATTIRATIRIHTQLIPKAPMQRRVPQLPLGQKSIRHLLLEV